MFSGCKAGVSRNPSRHIFDQTLLLFVMIKKKIRKIKLKLRGTQFDCYPKNSEQSTSSFSPGNPKHKDTGKDEARELPRRGNYTFIYLNKSLIFFQTAYLKSYLSPEQKQIIQLSKKKTQIFFFGKNTVILKGTTTDNKNWKLYTSNCVLGPNADVIIGLDI